MEIHFEPLKNTFGIGFQKNLMHISGSNIHAKATNCTGNRSARWLDSHKLDLSTINEERSKWSNQEDYTNILYGMEQIRKQIQQNRKSQEEEVGILLSDENKDETYSRMVRCLGLDFSAHVARVVSEQKNWYVGEEKKHTGKIKQDLLFNHLKQYVTLSLPSYNHSKLLRITINKGNLVNSKLSMTGVEMAKVVASTLGEPQFVERSIAFKEVVILYYMFDEYIPDAKRVALESFFYSMYKFKVDISKKDTMKFETVPFSKLFPEFGTYEPDSPFTVVNQKGIDESLSILETIIPLSHKLVARITKGILETEELVVEKKSINTLTKDYAIRKFTFGAGTRFVTLPKIAMWAVRNNYTFEKYKETVYLCNDGTSKDFNTQSEKVINKELLRCYDFAQRNVSFVQQTYLTVDADEDWKNSDGVLYRSPQQSDYTLAMFAILEDIVKMEFAVQYPSLQNTKWQSHMIRDCRKVMEFIIEKKKYDEMREKRYVNEELECLNGSVPIPTKLYKDMSSQLNLKSDVSKIMRILVKSGILKRVKVKGKAYSFGKTRYSYHYSYLLSIHQLSSILSSYYKYPYAILRGERSTDPYYVNYVADFSIDREGDEPEERPPD